MSSGHGLNNVTAFAEPRLVEVLRANWPEVIEHARVAGARDLSVNDAESRWKLSRRRGGPRLSMGVEANDGSIYVSIGGGYMSDGRSSTAVQCAYTLMNRATELDANCQERRDRIVEAIQIHLDQPVEEVDLTFKLTFLECGLEYQGVDELSGVGVGNSGRICFQNARGARCLDTAG